MIKKYSVARREPIVEMTTRALELCGVDVLVAPDPREAPFEFSVRLPSGERLELVCYAFTANKYRQKGRPPDEHRFQIKYGGEFDRAHDIYIDPKREIVTLFMGVHLEAGVFVGADPHMHTPTWFSSSVEFKTHHVQQGKASGWFGWERDRSDARRQAGREAQNCQTEALIVFTPENLLRYIQFERIATGLDPGERLLLGERVSRGDVERAIEHPLEQLYGLTAKEVLDVIWQRFRLGVAVRGGVAEHHLGKFLRSQPSISSVTDIDEDGRPDFAIIYRETPILLECKNVLRKTHADGKPRIDFQKTRASKGDWCSRYYEPSAFDVLAACLHPVTEKWQFTFACTTTLEPHDECKGRLSPRVVIGGEHWKTNLCSLLDSKIRT